MSKLFWALREYGYDKHGNDRKALEAWLKKGKRKTQHQIRKQSAQNKHLN